MTAKAKETVRVKVKAKGKALDPPFSSMGGKGEAGKNASQ